MRTVVITSGPAALTFEQVLAQLREVSTAEQLLLTTVHMPAAEAMFLQTTGCHPTTTLLEHRQAGWPVCDTAIKLKRGPVQAVASVRYTDPLGVEQTLPGTAWRLRHVDEQTAMVLLLDTPALQEGSEVVVGYTAGFATVPPDVTAWLLGHVAYLWAHRGDEDMPADPLPHLNNLIAGWARTPI
jgi:uncharacterized phiE125 gp8 family phage protein